MGWWIERIRSARAIVPEKVRPGRLVTLTRSFLDLAWMEGLALRLRHIDVNRAQECQYFSQRGRVYV